MVEIRKYDPDEIFSVVYIEGETQKMYLKRFCIEKDVKLNTRTSFIGEHEAAKYLSLSTDVMSRLQLSYQVSDAGNSFPDDEINVEEFIGIKSFKAKGKRLSNREIESFQWLEPFEPEILETPEPSGSDESSSSVPEEPETPETTEVSETQRPEVPRSESSDGIQMELF